MDQNPLPNQPQVPTNEQPVVPTQPTPFPITPQQPMTEPAMPQQATMPTPPMPTMPQPPASQPPQPTPPSSSFSLMRVIGLSLSVLLVGLAIAYGGFYFFILRQQKPAVEKLPTPVAKPTTKAGTTSATMQQYINTAYGYRLEYPSDLTVSGEGLQTTETTAPDVTFTNSTNAATPNPLRVFHISIKDKNLLTVSGKPISSYTPMEIATMDLQATMNNKNIYVATLAPVTQIQSLPKNILSGYAFSVRAKGYQTTSDGVLWDLGDYVVTEYDSAKYHYVIVYSATDEMKQLMQTMQFSQ